MRLLLKYEDTRYEVQDCNRIAWDGCHKIYLITSHLDVAEAVSWEYTLLDVSELPRVYEESCSLRFIEFWDVRNIKHPVIRQFEDAAIEIDQVASTITITVTNPDAIDEFIEKGELTFYGEI